MNLILVLGAYINGFIQSGQIDWYLSQLLDVKSGDTFYLVQLLNDYLLLAPDAEKEQAIQPLFNLAIEHPNLWVRLTAFQGLMAIDDLDGVKEKMTVIKSIETDQNLLEIYRGY